MSFIDVTARRRLTTLMVRLADGDRAAFNEVFQILWPALSAFCTRTLPSADALDAAQAVLLKVFEQAHHFHRDKDAVTWIFTIALWEVRTVRRQYSRSRMAPWNENETDSSETDPEELSERREATAKNDFEVLLVNPEMLLMEREDIDSAFAVFGTLSDIDRATLQATFNDEPLITLGPTFRKRKQRARERLRQAWMRAFGS